MIFVAVGLVVLVALGLAVAFRGSITKALIDQETQTQSSIDSQVDKVQAHIESCLKDSLSTAITRTASKKVDDYDKALSDEMTYILGTCLNLEFYLDLSIKTLSQPEIRISRNPDNTVITATLSMPTVITFGEESRQLDEFVAQDNLKKKMCVLSTQIDSDCKALEDLKVGVFLFEKGQEVKIGGDCLAC